MGFGVVPRFTDAATRVLCAHRWPGNVRELRNVVQRTVLLARRGVIDVDDLPSPLRASPPDAPPPPPVTPDPAKPDLLRDEIEELERRRVIEALDACAGNQTRAAQMLGISRRALIRRIEAYEIPRPRKGRGDQ